MNDKELFEEILNRIAASQKLEIKRPYNDCYIEIYKNGINLGCLNYEGHNLAFNVYKLGSILGFGYDVLFK